MTKKMQLTALISSLLILTFLTLDFIESDIEFGWTAIVGLSLGILIAMTIITSTYHKSKRLSENEKFKKISNQLESRWFRISFAVLLLLVILKIWKLF